MEPTKSQLIYKNACLSEGIEKLQIENEELRVQNEALCLKVKHIKEVMGDLTFYYKEKLAESEEKCKKAYQEGLLQKQFDKNMEIEQLKQQLAEYSDINNNLNKGLSEKCILCEEEYKQAKINYAVEQLKRVKEMVFDNSNATGCVFAEQTIDVEDFEKVIDQLITEIKEGINK